MIHTILIAVHASAGVVAFVSGCFAIRRPALFPLYFVALTVSVGTLVVAVVEEWMRIDTVSRIVFSGLIVLAAAMVVRADAARRIGRGDAVRTRGGDRGTRRPESSTEVVLDRYHHMVFTLISLFAAYIVIQVRGLGAPLWVVLGSVAVSSVAGHVAAGWFEGRAIRPVVHVASPTPR